MLRRSMVLKIVTPTALLPTSTTQHSSKVVGSRTCCSVASAMPEKRVVGVVVPPNLALVVPHPIVAFGWMPPHTSKLETLA